MRYFPTPRKKIDTHVWFAWYPVYAHNKKDEFGWVWWEKVNRKSGWLVKWAYTIIE